MFLEQLEKKTKQNKSWFSNKVDGVGEVFHNIFSKLRLEGAIKGCFLSLGVLDSLISFS